MALKSDSWHHHFPHQPGGHSHSGRTLRLCSSAPSLIHSCYLLPCTPTTNAYYFHCVLSSFIGCTLPDTRWLHDTRIRQVDNLQRELYMVTLRFHASHLQSFSGFDSRRGFVPIQLLWVHVGTTVSTAELKSRDILAMFPFNYCGSMWVQPSAQQN